jgi:hypothetical protein
MATHRDLQGSLEKLRYLYHRLDAECIVSVDIWVHRDPTIVVPLIKGTSTWSRRLVSGICKLLTIIVSIFSVIYFHLIIFRIMEGSKDPTRALVCCHPLCMACVIGDQLQIFDTR